MSRMDLPLMASWEATQLNPLMPSPVAVLVALIVGGLACMALVAAGVFLGMRMASRRSANEASRQEVSRL